MASTDKPAPEPEKAAPPPPPPLESELPAKAPQPANYFTVDVFLRILLFASTLVAVLVMVTSKQTKLVPLAGLSIRRLAKFNHSPAFIYFVVALSVACLYSIITLLASFLVILKPVFSTKFLLHIALIDVLMLGLVASATGAAAGVAYIGLKGNSHVGWAKVCNNYDKFCRHLGSSIAISLFASVLLVLLIMLSTWSLYRRIR